jgi:nitroreductase
VFTMDLFEAIIGRRSIRRFKKDMVKDDIIMKVIEAGTWAPSAGNLQSWEVVMVKNSETKEKLVTAAYLREFLAGAPIILVLCANQHECGASYNDRGVELYCIQDAACAGQNILLAAHALGLGACWVGAFDEDLVVQALHLPPGLRPVSLIPMGYPDENPSPPPRGDLEEFIHYERFK